MVLGVSLGWIPPNPRAPDSDGDWVMVSGRVDGEEISGAALTIDERLAGSLLVFEIDGVRLVYERVN